MAVYSMTLGNLLAVDSVRCSVGPGIGTDGTRGTFFGALAGQSASSSTSDVVALGYASDIGSLTSNSVAVGCQASVGASDNTVAIGSAAFSNVANTFVMGSVANPLIPVAYYSPFTHFRTKYTYTASKNFTTDPLGAAPLVSGLVVFNISTNVSVTLPTSAQCLAQLHDYVTGSYVFGYMSNTNTGSASVTIAHPPDTNYYPTSVSTLTAGHGMRIVIKYNGTSIDYIM